MPYDVSGNYTLPSPDYPLIPDTLADANIVNAIFSDISAALNGVLLRDGTTPLTGALLLTGGTTTNPGIAFNGESGTGFSRAAAGRIGISVLGAEVGRWTANGLSARAGTAALPGVHFLGASTDGLYSAAVGSLGFTTAGVSRAVLSAASFSITPPIIATGGITGTLMGSASTLTTPRTIALSGAATGTATAFDGSANISIPVTALNASNLSAGTIPDARFPATLPAASGANLTALNASNIASGTISDARLPASISSDITGNAATATILATSRTISLTGDATASGSFNGSANLALAVTVVDDSHNHIISNVDGLQAELDSKAEFTTSASMSLTNYPIGSVILCAAARDARNALIVPRLSTTNDDTFTTAGAGSVLTGTWRTRGNDGTGNYQLCQRVS